MLYLVLRVKNCFSSIFISFLVISRERGGAEKLNGVESNGGFPVICILLYNRLIQALDVLKDPDLSLGTSTALRS